MSGGTYAQLLDPAGHLLGDGNPFWERRREILPCVLGISAYFILDYKEPNPPQKKTFKNVASVFVNTDNAIYVLLQGSFHSEQQSV